MREKNVYKKNLNKKNVKKLLLMGARQHHPYKNIENKITVYYLVIGFVTFHQFKIFKGRLVTLF